MTDYALADGMGVETLLQLLPDDPLSPLPWALTDLLRKIYAAEACLALDLTALIQECRSPMVRLALSNQRRETVGQIARLCAMLPLNDHVARSGTFDGDACLRPSERPTVELIAGPLQAVRNAIAAYRSAIILATEAECGTEADLLAESLAEETATARRLTGLGGAFGLH